MKTQLFGLSKAAAAAQILGMSLLLLISCNNFLAPPQEGDPAGNGETGTVLLSFGNGVEGARTLLPGGATFTLYRLTITPVAPTTGSPIQHDISSPPSGTITLAAGTWNIHADAYTGAGGTNKAAEGDSGTITVSAHAVKQVTITLGPISGGGNGILSVNISDGGGGIAGGMLFIFNGPEFNTPVPFFDGVDIAYDAEITSSGLDLDISLPSGQYRVAAGISSATGQFYIINEVAYICSGLTTGLTKSITAGDFTGGAEMTEISGTVEYSVDSVPQSGYVLSAYVRDYGVGYYYGNRVSEVLITGTGSQSYTISVPKPDTPITLYFYIEKDGFSTPAAELSLSSGQAAATEHISLSAISLSGTVSITVGGSSPAPDSLLTVNANELINGDGHYFSEVSGNAWAMKVRDDSGTLSFSVSVWDDQQYLYGVGADSWEWTYGSSPNTGIALDEDFILVKGSFTATENGNPIKDVLVWAHPYSPLSGMSGGRSGFDWVGNICTWDYTTTAPSSSGSVEFIINIGSYEDSIKATETVSLGPTSNITIPQKVYNFTSIGGMVTDLPLEWSGGTLYVFSEPVTTFSDFYTKMPLALCSAEINSGVFSGSVLDSISSGYVVIGPPTMVSPDPINPPRYFPSPVTLGPLMPPLNFSDMTSLSY